MAFGDTVEPDGVFGKGRVLIRDVISDMLCTRRNGECSGVSLLVVMNTSMIYRIRVSKKLKVIPRQEEIHEENYLRRSRGSPLKPL